jgi:hypothetical protein
LFLQFIALCNSSSLEQEQHTREAPTLGYFLGQLVDIYAQHKSFVNGEGTREAKAVGKLIHNYYGFTDMRRVCSELGTTVRGNAVPELNSVWDGIEGWQR